VALEKIPFVSAYANRDGTETVHHGTHEPLLRDAAMTRAAWLGLAGVVVTVIGFAKTIEPVIEVGVALVIMALITNPKTKA
jgi:hypothetical protein